MIKYINGGGVLSSLNKNAVVDKVLDSIFATYVISKPLTNPFAYMFNQTINTNAFVSPFCVID